MIYDTVRCITQNYTSVTFSLLRAEDTEGACVCVCLDTDNAFT